jgi:hypothetical protein
MDALRTPPRPILWAILGLVTALAVQVGQAVSLGGWSSLLAVGQNSPLRPIVERELGDAIVIAGSGHDGHVAYVVALDPFALEDPEVVPNAAYRYRRILYPVLAGGFGSVDGESLLWSLVGLNAIGFTMAVYWAGALATIRKLPVWIPLAALLNIGLWLSLQVSSPDVLAFALMLFGLVAHFRGRVGVAVILLALATLTKEVYGLVPLSLAAYAWRSESLRRAWPYLTSLLPLGLWSLYLVARLRDPFETGGNLTWPLGGIIDGASSWPTNAARDLFFLAFTGLALIAAGWLVARRPASVWSWLAAPWLALALVSSHWVWDFGNNVARAFLPCLAFAAFGLTDLKEAGLRTKETNPGSISQPRTSRRNLPV